MCVRPGDEDSGRQRSLTSFGHENDDDDTELSPFKLLFQVTLKTKETQCSTDWKIANGD